MNKKLLSLIMAIAMIASMALPSFATGEGTGSGDFTYDSTTNIARVTVTMPTPSASGDIVLNPYGMAVTVGSGDLTDQIVSATQFITNKTLSPMKVGVKATATKSGDVTIVNRPCSGRETTKNAYLIVEFQNLDTNAEPEKDSWKLEIASGDLISGDTINERLYPQIVPTEAGKTAAGIMSVPAATKSGGSVTPNYIGMKVFGNLSSAPTEAWKSADKAGVKLEFTFTPAVTHEATSDGTTVKVSSTIDNASETGSARAVMGTVIRINATNGVMPTAKDANGDEVAIVQANETNNKLYYLTMPATDVTITAGS